VPDDPSLLPFHVVCAGLITRADGALLIARRPPGGFMPGYWEFPGGKLEPGETPEAGLAREIREELGVEVADARIFHVMAHAYPDRRVLILFYRCAIRAGDPSGPEAGGLEHAWVKPAELPSYAMLPADAEVIDRILGEG
jgi:8-oxo-dGTP diphosphatase